MLSATAALDLVDSPESIQACSSRSLYTRTRETTSGRVFKLISLTTGCSDRHQRITGLALHHSLYTRFTGIGVKRHPQDRKRSLGHHDNRQRSGPCPACNSPSMADSLYWTLSRRTPRCCSICEALDILEPKRVALKATAAPAQSPSWTAGLETDRPGVQSTPA